MISRVQFEPASRVAAGIGQPLRVSPDTDVSSGEAPAALLLAFNDLLADFAHRRREGARVATPDHQGMGLASIAQVWPRPPLPFGNTIRPQSAPMSP